MRTIFIAVSKVFGLVQIYTGLLAIGSVVSMIPLLYCFSTQEKSLPSYAGMSFALLVGTLIWTLFITFGFAWLLIFKAEWLADKLKIPKETETEGLSKETLIMTGVILLGLYITVQAAPPLLSTMIHYFLPSGDGFSSWTLGLNTGLFSGFLPTCIPQALKLALGLLLAFKASKVTALITQGDQSPEPSDGDGSSEDSVD